MKLIHCSDLHLDSKMSAHLSAEQAQNRNLEICAAFERMIAYAKSYQVSAILIAGDMFDERRVLRSTIDLILNMIKQHNTLDFLYLRGNHDALTGIPSAKLPQNLKLFSDSWTSYRCGNVVVSGVELTSENYAQIYDDLSLNAEDINIVTLHGTLGATPMPEQVCLNKLKNKNIDYLALGHIHSYQSGAIDHRGTYCYSGCLEGRGFDECGSKGFVLLDINQYTVHATFVPFAKRKLWNIEVDISGSRSAADILQLMQSNSLNIPTCDMVKFILCGQCSFYSSDTVSILKKMLDDRFYFVEIDDRSTVGIDTIDYKRDISLKGEFTRRVLADSSLSESDANEILQLGLAALCGEELKL